MQEEGMLSIGEPGRVRDMLEKISQLHLPLSIRKKGEEILHIRGQAEALRLVESKNGAYTEFQITQISTNGISLLEEEETVKIECPLVTSKLEFFSILRKKEKDSIWLSCPPTLSTIERRKDSRFILPKSAIGYVKFSLEWEKKQDAYSLPCFPFYTDFASLLYIIDISTSGLCIETCLPFSFYALKKYRQDKSFPIEAALFLPLQPEIPFSFNMRWMKKIRDASGQRHTMKEPKITYRFGCEFTSESREKMEPILLQFLQQLAFADAI